MLRPDFPINEDVLTPDTSPTPSSSNTPPANQTPFDALTQNQTTTGIVEPDAALDETPLDETPLDETPLDATSGKTSSPQIFDDNISPTEDTSTRIDTADATVQSVAPLDPPTNAVPVNAVPVLVEARPRRARWPWVVGFMLVLLGAGAAGGIWWRNEQIRLWKWEAIVMPELSARVPEEWPVEELAERLKETRKIRDRETFLEAAAQTKLRRVAPGGYILPAKAGPLELAKIFAAPPGLVKVTFPEGWTGERMAARLEARDFTHARELRRLIYPPQQTVSPWEGRLFPETYWLPQRGKAPQLVSQMNDRFKTVTQGLPRPFPIGAGGKRLTLDEVVTLASIVERETSVPDERPIVAGVLINRLQKGMRLQCDATVQYALERAQASGQLPTGRQSRLRFRDIDAVQLSPYNTYKIKALPPGPICNPGEAALFAAAKPKASKYLFYVMSPRLGHHRFAEDFAGHSENVRLYRKELRD